MMHNKVEQEKWCIAIWGTSHQLFRAVCVRICTAHAQ